MTDIGIRGARILDPLTGTEKTADILIRDGKRKFDFKNERENEC